jgi:hypothetical protein
MATIRHDRQQKESVSQMDKGLNHTLHFKLVGYNEMKLKVISIEYLPQKALDNR